MNEPLFNLLRRFACHRNVIAARKLAMGEVASWLQIFAASQKSSGIALRQGPVNLPEVDLPEFNFPEVNLLDSKNILRRAARITRYKM